MRISQFNLCHLFRWHFNFSKMQDEHDLHVLQVLCMFDQHGLLTSVDKCEFNKESLEYLGFIIGKDGISMHPSKLSTISNWPEPQSAKEIQHFSRTCKFLSMIYFPLCLHCSAAIQLNMKGSFGFICFVPYCPFHLQLSQIRFPICPCSYSSWSIQTHQCFRLCYFWDSSSGQQQGWVTSFGIFLMQAEWCRN